MTVTERIFAARAILRVISLTPGASMSGTSTVRPSTIAVCAGFAVWTEGDWVDAFQFGQIGVRNVRPRASLELHEVALAQGNDSVARLEERALRS
jgi:hypothetical protein